jgi:hypothetical protein
MSGCLKEQISLPEQRRQLKQRFDTLFARTPKKTRPQVGRTRRPRGNGRGECHPTPLDSALPLRFSAPGGEVAFVAPTLDEAAPGYSRSDSLVIPVVDATR